MNIGTHQYLQQQRLPFHLPDSAGRAQAALKPGGQGTEVSEDKHAKEELLVPFTCLGAEPSNASSLESRCAGSLALALASRFSSTSKPCSKADARGLAGKPEAPKGTCRDLSLPLQPQLCSHGWGARLGTEAAVGLPGEHGWDVSEHSYLCSCLAAGILLWGHFPEDQGPQCPREVQHGEKDLGCHREQFLLQVREGQTDNTAGIPLWVCTIHS